MAKSSKKANNLNPDLVLKQMGERIKSLRIAAGHSSHETFAYENDFNRAQYSRYERGEDLRVSTLVRIVQAFGMTMEEFFSEGFD
jgi:transcriptional regulator with XRE-family HTH domain